MSKKYQKKTINNKPIYQKISQNKIKNIDTIIFDCDGVLIDTKKSYDKCIELTISYILKNNSKTKVIKVKSKAKSKKNNRFKMGILQI